MVLKCMRSWMQMIIKLITEMILNAKNNIWNCAFDTLIKFNISLINVETDGCIQLHNDTKKACNVCCFSFFEF